MYEGGGFSFGGAGRSDLGWTVVLAKMGENTRSGEPVRAGDMVHLRGIASGTYFHSNPEEGGGYSGGGFWPDAHGWIIEKGNKGKGKIRIGEDIMLKSQDWNKYLHSNMEEGGGCSWGGWRASLGWNVQLTR